MTNRRIELMLDNAMDIIQTMNFFEPGHTPQRIPSKYFGYMASFGPSVIQCSLLQTIYAYNKESTAEGQERKKILTFMERVLHASGYLNETNYENETIIEFVSRRTSAGDTPAIERIFVRRLILDCATACKNVMQTYPKVENTDQRGRL